MVTAVVMLFLIATVVYALSLMLNVSSGNVIDGQRQGDATAAFFLAESGVEKVQATMAATLLNGGFTNANCTGTASSFNLGRGSVSTTAVSTPATCDIDGATPCTTCTVTSVGRVGPSTRTVTQDLVLATTNGVICNSAYTNCRNTPSVTWQLNLKNKSALAGIGLFNLTYDTQGNTSAACTASSHCSLEVDTNSPSNGAGSTGLMANAVLIPSNTTYPIYQTLSKNKNAAEVGAFFLGTTAPTLTGPAATGGAAYWSTASTVGKGTSVGSTNDGTFTAPGTCAAPSASAQTCQSWCYGGDTLAFAFAGKVNQLTDQLASVTFGTNAGTGQNIAMTRIAKYPGPGITGAPTTLDAEIWYARNPNLTGASPLAVNASSYKGRGTGTVGATWTSNNSDTTAINGTTLTVGNSFNSGTNAYPGNIISVGDVLSSSNGGGGGDVDCTGGCPTIVAQITSTETGGMATGMGGRGTYQISKSQALTARNNRAWTISSTVLHVTACTVCYFAAGDALSVFVAGRTISAQSSASNAYGSTETAGGIGRYTMSGAAVQLVSANTVHAGTPGATLYLPATSSQPSVTTPAMLVTVKSGTGAMAPGTTVTAVSAPNGATAAFTVSTAPTTALDLATVCAGTCAFFLPNGTTSFSLGGMTASFDEWASGFVCIKGVDVTPAIVTRPITVSRQWTEVVQ
jgi:hypothetical protein